jgi:ArsR family transcriptional regulator
MAAHRSRLLARRLIFAYANMTASELFAAFADPTRLRLLNLLRLGETCVGDLVAILGVPQPTASRHLGRLRRAGLVTVREQGRWAYYALSPKPRGLRGRLLGCLGNGDPQARRDLARARALRKSGGCCPR